VPLVVKTTEVRLVDKEEGFKLTWEIPTGKETGGSALTAVELLWDAGKPEATALTPILSGFKTYY
jgi:hypothetical protein